MKIGAHLSIAGGYEEALKRATAIGANALQIFSGNPRSFSGPNVSARACADFRKEAEKLKISPIYFHAPYLVNLASEEPTGDSSVTLLISELSVAARAGVSGSIIHLGSYKKAAGEEKERQKKLLIKRIKTILASTPSGALFIAENSGTRKIGQTLDELSEVVNEVNNSRLRICLDTCHLHVAGYDLCGKEKLEAFLKEFDKKIGLERLECFHLNDSRDEFGSLRDRHDNIGEGKVGKEVFKLILNHPKLKHLPFILEVPGFDDQGPDQKNVELVQSLSRS